MDNQTARRKNPAGRSQLVAPKATPGLAGGFDLTVAEDMSADLPPDLVIFRVSCEIHHIHGQNIGAGQSGVDGLVLGLPGLRLIQEGSGSELTLAV